MYTCIEKKIFIILKLNFTVKLAMMYVNIMNDLSSPVENVLI